MAGIYGSSVLTISVPNATDCTEPFLRRSLDDFATVEVDWIHGYSGIAGTATLVYDWPQDHGSLLPKSPWMNRGWTFQEWVLSPCVLHCGSTLTVYECLHGTCYESHSDEINQPFESVDSTDSVSPDVCKSASPRLRVHANTWPMDTNIAREHGSLAEMVNTRRLFERVVRVQHGHLETQADSLGPSWSDVVTEFCGRQLTKDIDKLPALAGLAVRFQNYKNYTLPEAEGREYDYLAGLWWNGGLSSDLPSEAAELPTGLLWRRADDEFLSKPATYRAPSWSWAALDGPVEFLGSFRPPDLSKVQIHDAICIYDYPNSLSSVKAGWIDATGLLKRAWPVKTRESIDLGTTDDAEGQDGDFSEDKWSVRFDENVNGSRWKEMQRFEIFLFLIATNYSPNSFRGTHHALVLKRVAAEKACNFDCFTRLGTAQISLAQISKHNQEQEHILEDWDQKKVRLL